MSENMNTNVITDETEVIVNEADKVNTELSDSDLEEIQGGYFNPMIHQYKNGLSNGGFVFWGTDVCQKCHQRKTANYVQYNSILRCAACYNRFGLYA